MGGGGGGGGDMVIWYGVIFVKLPEEIKMKKLHKFELFQYFPCSSDRTHDSICIYGIFLAHKTYNLPCSRQSRH
jgi:hypothetical protein